MRSLPLAEPSREPLEAKAQTLPGELAKRTTAGVLHEPFEKPHPSGKRALRCTACAHRCVMEEGRTGACGVRTHVDGTIQVPFGYVARSYVRAVETNTLYHVRPGAKALTFGMYGCDLRCPYCHNHRVSQALRDPSDRPEHPRDVSAVELVEQAIAEGCEVICSAYNEPMITAEWAHAVFTEAKRRGLVTAVITDGHSTKEALAYLRPVTDVFRVDLKGITQEHYKTLGGRLEPVLESIAEAHRLGYWIEVVTLVVPGFNDAPEDLARVAAFLVDLDPNIPWHVDAFHPRYKLQHLPETSPMLLAMAAGSGYGRGLRHVYVGNVGDALPELSATRCTRCETTLVERRDWTCTRNALVAGACPSCGEKVVGRFATT